jgi:hypothetical protein
MSALQKVIAILGVGIAECPVSLDEGWSVKYQGGWSEHREAFKGEGRASQGDKQHL